MSASTLLVGSVVCVGITCAARLFDPDTEHTRVPQW